MAACTKQIPISAFSMIFKFAMKIKKPVIVLTWGQDFIQVIIHIHNLEILNILLRVTLTYVFFVGIVLFIQLFILFIYFFFIFLYFSLFCFIFFHFWLGIQFSYNFFISPKLPFLSAAYTFPGPTAIFCVFVLFDFYIFCVTTDNRYTKSVFEKIINKMK